MNTKIRPMVAADKPWVMEMMGVFYASPAVLSNGSGEIFSSDIDACVGDNSYAEGYIIENENDIQGYAMIAKSFSTEFGKKCIWIEDLYLKEAYRGLGIGKLLLQAVIDTARQKGIDYLELEVVADNVRAIGLYERMGFETLCCLPDAIRWEDGSSHDLLTMRKVL